jgi:L-alanine-DL-glutamate epimerase-like enolase superfamily enzyme
LDREKIEKEIARKWRMGHALAVFDMCLWDIAGKAMNLPVYKLLGAQKDKVLAYACTLAYDTIEEYVDLARKCQKNGYRAYKIHSTQDWKKDIELCRALREAMGADMALMLDPVFGYDREGALKVGKEIEKLDFLYYEDPIPTSDIDGLAWLCRSLDIDIVVGEAIMSLYEYNSYIRRHAVDILRTGPITSCGITGMMKIAHLAEAHGMRCEPFNYGSMLAQAASFHVELANENC